jgi:hypothetical protein
MARNEECHRMAVLWNMTQSLLRVTTSQAQGRIELWPREGGQPLHLLEIGS